MSSKGGKFVNERFGAYSPPTPDGPGDTTSTDPFTAHGVSPAEISQSQQGSAMERELAAIRSKMKRLEGHSNWNGKQYDAYCELMAKQLDIMQPNWRDGMGEFLDELRTTGNVESR